MAALLLTRERREFVKPGIWIGGAIALLLFLPNILWQVRHGYPTIEDLRNVKRMGRTSCSNPIEFIVQQIQLLHPLLLPIWLDRARFASSSGGGSRMRVLGWTYLVLLARHDRAAKAKNYYLAPIYPMLFASGAVAIEGWLERRAVESRAALAEGRPSRSASSLPARSRFRRSCRSCPPEKLLAYQRRIGVAPPKTEVRHEGPLEQRLGDQFGWEELVAGRGADLPVAAAGGAGADRHLREQLRRGRAP